MKTLLTRWFRLEPGELSRVFAFMLLGGVLQAGLAIGHSAADSLFLTHIGASRLPVIYVAMPVLMSLYIPAYTFLLGRYGVNRVFDFTLALLVLGGLGCYFALTFVPGPAPYYGIKFYASLWYVGLYTLFWNFVDGHFDLGKAKRLFGLLAAGPATGAICGGALVEHFAESVPVPTFFLAWAGLALLVWPVVLTIRRRWRPIASEGDEPEARPKVRDTLREIVGSRFVTVLIAVLFITLVTATICEYQYLGIFSASTDEKTLAGLFGELYAGVNVFNLCIALFVFNKLVLRIGVRNVALIQPIAYLVVFALLLIHGSFGPALLGFLAYQGIMTSIDFNNVNLLFNGLPEESRSRVRTLIEGMCEPLATATAGVFLFFVAPRLSSENLSAIGFGCAVVLLALVFLMRADYVKSMVANVRRSWLDFTRTPAGLAGLAEGDLVLLEQRVDRPDAGERLTALRLLCVNAPVRALGRVLHYLSNATRQERPAAQPLVASLFATRDPQVLLQSMQWSERHGETVDPYLLEELGRHRLVPAEIAANRIGAADPGERAAAAALLWRSSRLPHGHAALQTVDRLLHGDTSGTVAGIHGLGRMGEARYVPHLLPHLQSPELEVRLETLRALGELANRDSTRIVPPLLRLLAGGGTLGERELVLELIGRIADSNSLPQLLALAGRFTPHERRTVEQLVIQFGPRAVPSLMSVTQNLDSPLFARLIAIRTLGQLAFPQLETMAPALIDAAVSRAYMLAGCSAALEDARDPGPGLATLAVIYRLLPRLTLEMVLEILSVTGRLPSYDSIVTALHSGSVRDRGYAMENIEQGAGRKLFARIEPLLDDRPVAEVVRAGRLFGFNQPTDIAFAVDRSIRVRFPLEAGAALQALDETRPGAATPAALEILRQNPAPLLRETALTLLARMEGAGREQLTPVERIQALSRGGFFRAWGVRQLEFVGRQLREVPGRAGRALAPQTRETDGVHVIVRGTFAVNGRRLGPGENFGGESLFGRDPRRVEVRAETDGLALFVPAGDILTCARIYPEVALELLRRKFAPAA
ncbi:MAG TPA: cyclic nucleotide-binding domain-containing protein [Opitutaceae bacterium]|nr:cyclic nucleotide-binding domain-containing protein [Opitutaceae bacterium]